MLGRVPDIGRPPQKPRRVPQKHRKWARRVLKDEGGGRARCKSEAKSHPATRRWRSGIGGRCCKRAATPDRLKNLRARVGGADVPHDRAQRSRLFSGVQGAGQLDRPGGAHPAEDAAYGPRRDSKSANWWPSFQMSVAPLLQSSWTSCHWEVYEAVASKRTACWPMNAPSKSV